MQPTDESPIDEAFPGGFHAATRAWFQESFSAPTPVQSEGWQRIAAGEHALLVAPTGSGKTLAAFLYAIDRLITRTPAPGGGVRVLYVSPLKALVYDVERNLRAPLSGIRRTLAGCPGATAAAVNVDIRTGDTPQAERRRQLRSPGEVLVTTPESLYLLLGSRAREGLRTVDTVIVDEVHALMPNKRGAHLALSLERLAAITATDPQRIGLSATVNPPQAVARFLGGDRDVRVVDARSAPRLDLTVSVPVPDMERVPAAQETEDRSGSILAGLYAREVGTPAKEKGIWPVIYPRLVEEIRAHRSTIVFVNSRGLCERLAQRMNEIAGEELALAHHGSVSHEQRRRIEDGLKAGELKAIVATSSLELGIDMGAVDRVIMVESPGSVARGLQRIGRAGHQVDAPSRGSLYPKYRGDLLECAVIASRMLEGAIESVRAPRNPLDVLAQQLVAICADGEHDVDALHRLVVRAAPYRELGLDLLLAVLDMLSGKYPSAEFADLRPRLNWDRSRDVITARRGSAMVARVNGGTIADRGLYPVHLGGDGPRIGELDEEMVFETRPGENVLLGASTWRVEEIGRDRVVVTPAPGEPGRLPFWRGDGPGRPLELGQAIGRFLRELGGLPAAEARRHLQASLPLDAHAAGNLVAYLQEQRAHTGVLPSDRTVVVERFRDELGDWRICILTPFGARVHAPWAMALQRELEVRSGFEVQLMYTDDGIVLRLADTDDLPDLEALLPDPDRVEELVTEQLADTAMFASLFRENASRALLITRRRPGARTPLWAQRRRAEALLSTVRRYPGFPIVMETYRQALADIFDLQALKDLLRRIRSREVRLHEVSTRSASPFARSLVFAYVAAYIYEQDAPLAERRAQALTLDREMLSQLLGHAELRELIDAQVLAELELELACLARGFGARDADGLHDLLRRLGDLDREEVLARCEGDGEIWLAELEAARRAVAVRVAGVTRFIAVEDVALYRDAVGSNPPPGLPERLLAPVEAPVSQLLARFARVRGPFPGEDAARRFRLPLAEVEEVLAAAEAEGRLVRGEIRPTGTQKEWCDARVLAQLKRRTLARLRREIAAVDAATLCAFLPRWHGLGEAEGGTARLEEVLRQLEGFTLSWRVLVDQVLPARVSGFSLEMLDLWAATGRGIWVGRGASGPGDGRIALYSRERAGRLLALPEEAIPAVSDVAAAVLEALRGGGACFVTELELRVREQHPGTTTSELEEAIWDLVWDGRISNDTFQPLRTLGRRGGRRREAMAGGRWFLVDTLVDRRRSETEHRLALVEMLLERYGVVSRECVVGEELGGGFGPIYRVLRAMEDSGRVRRGYFVEGLGSAQFALPGAVDRLRAARPEEADEAPLADPEVLVIAATDPANVFGASVAWPATGDRDGARPRRVAGASVVMARGEALLYVSAGGRALRSFPAALARWPDALATALRAVARMPRRGRRRLLVVEKIDGAPVDEGRHGPALRAAGFVSDYRGYTLLDRP